MADADLDEGRSHPVDGSKYEGGIHEEAQNSQEKNLDDSEATRLEGLATEVRDQTDLERDVQVQADQLLTAQANARDEKRLEKTRADRLFVITSLSCSLDMLADSV